MAAAFDAATYGGLTGSGSVSHAPVGTPRGVAVLIVQDVSSSDLISGVTYGGVAMTRVATGVDTSGEPGRAYLYFLGSGVLTGTQNATVTVSSGTDAKAVWVLTVTAAADTESAAGGNASENQANPAVTLATGAGFSGIAVAAIFSGLGVITNVTAGSGYTKLDGSAAGGHDFGTSVACCEHGSKSGANVVADFVSATDDVAMVAMAIQEVAGGSTTPLTLTATATAGASVARHAQRVLALAAVAAPSVVRQAARALSAAASGSPTVQTVKVKLATLVATAAGSAVLSRLVGKRPTATAAGTPSAVRSSGRTLTATATGQPSATRASSKSFAATGSGSPTIASAKVKLLTLAAAAAATTTLARAVGRRLTATGTAAVTVARRAFRSLTATSTGTPTVTRRSSRTFAAAASSVASLISTLVSSFGPRRLRLKDEAVITLELSDQPTIKLTLTDEAVIDLNLGEDG